MPGFFALPHDRRSSRFSGVSQVMASVSRSQIRGVNIPGCSDPPKSDKFKTLANAAGHGPAASAVPQNRHNRAARLARGEAWDRA